MIAWQEISLGDACEIYQPKTISSADFVDDGEYPVYGANGIIGRYDKFNHAEPQLLITCRGATCGSVNVSQPNSWINGNAMVVRSRDNSIELKYLEHLFRGGLNLTSVITGAAQPQITRQSLAPLKFRLPPLPEQRRIAAILDQADALRAKRREALAQLDSLTQSIFVEMFGDPSSNSKGWPEIQLSDVADLITGFAFRSEEYIDNSSESIRLCRGANVLPGKIDWDNLACWPLTKMKSLSEFEVREGDIVMAMDRPWISEGFKIAQATINDCPSLLVQRVARLRGKENISNDYIYHLLNQPAFTKHCKPTETTVPHISPKEIRSFKFFLPQIHLQKYFVKQISSINQLKAAHRSQLTAFNSLFTSLQHRAFRGEL